MMLATPFSSSSVRKIALPLPGRCRTRTSPATETRLPVRHRGQPRIGRDADAIEPLAQERHGMRLQRKAERAVIVDDMLAERHDRQAASPARCRARLISGCRTAAAVSAALLPSSARTAQRACAPVEAEGAEGVGLGQPLDLVDVEAGAQPDIAHRFDSRRHAARRTLPCVFSDSPLIWRKPSRTACRVLMTPRISAWRASDAARIEAALLPACNPSRND